jgi:hypothetical protein
MSIRCIAVDDEPLAIEKIKSFTEKLPHLQLVATFSKIIGSHSINELEKLLPHGFVRCHKSFIVSLSGINSIEHDRIRIGNKYIPIGNSYKEEFYKNI